MVVVVVVVVVVVTIKAELTSSFSFLSHLHRWCRFLYVH